MRKIGWMFHHAERLNREVTFLAGYRLAKADGLSGQAAIDAAADMTWKVHFDYQSSSRPRAMQGDLARIVTTFRNFTVNMLWRLFRDTHQSLHGASAAERAEARGQLIGITLSMMAHAGIRGAWGYGLLMMLLGMFFPGGGDDAEEWLQDALLMEGDGPGVAAWNFGMGMALNGAPGRILGADLTERIGMPNLWFRGDDRDLEGQDLYYTHMQELLGPVAGIPLGFYRGIEYAADGDWWRGVEAGVPKMVRDLMKAGRFSVGQPRSCPLHGRRTRGRFCRYRHLSPARLCPHRHRSRPQLGRPIPGPSHPVRAGGAAPHRRAGCRPGRQHGCGDWRGGRGADPAGTGAA